LEAGAKRVIISAPAKDEGITPTIVLGANDDQYSDQAVISNASCTTNCIVPVTAVLLSKFGIEKIMMSTIHSYTAEQNLVDGPPPGGKSNDLRRARAAAVNIIPTSTGAAISATQVFPELKGLFDGISFRVPTPVGSLSDFTVLLKKKTTKEELNQAFIDASQHPLYKGKLAVSDEPLVSSDIIGNPASCIVDLSLTQVIDGDFVKVVAWYDNEFGYSNRLVEQAVIVGKSIK
jgi:glyceraldehyde 3-phosphate dehydrogenase